MNQMNTVTVQDCIDRELVGGDGEQIGKIQDVYLDDETGQPEWFAVKTGWFGNKVSFVPIRDTATSDRGLFVPYTKAQVKDAPKAEPDGRLSEAEEAELYAHYGIGYGKSRSDSVLPEGQRAPGATGPERTGTQRGGNRTDDDNAMTRSEEELVTGTRQREAGRAKLVKYVETEHVDVTVPVKRERARLVTEPITDENRGEALEGDAIRENAHEEVLYEEEPVVEKRAVPKERVRLEKEETTDERDVDADLRKERITTEGDVDSQTRR